MAPREAWDRLERGARPPGSSCLPESLSLTPLGPPQGSVFSREGRARAGRSLLGVSPAGGLQGEGPSALGAGGRCEDGMLLVAANPPRDVVLQASKGLPMALQGGCAGSFIDPFMR